MQYRGKCLLLVAVLWAGVALASPTHVFSGSPMLPPTGYSATAATSTRLGSSK